MIKSKSKLYLVSDKGTKKRYDMFIVFTCDESMFEFKLDEWEVYKDDEWIEIGKIDNTSTEYFYVPNVIRVKFISSKAKVVIIEKPILTPVA